MIYSRAILVAVRQSAVDRGWTGTFGAGNLCRPRSEATGRASDLDLHCLLKLQEVKG